MYFTLQELTNSEVARKNNIRNLPGISEQGALMALVNKVLDPLRRIYGRPICVTSGYRCEKLNTLVGGASTSQHVKGEAVDISAHSKEANKDLFNIIKNTLPFDQLINEYDFQWVHVSYVNDGTNRGEVLKAEKKDGKTIYTKC